MNKKLLLESLNKLRRYDEIKSFLEELIKNLGNVDNEVLYYAMKKAQEISNEFEYQIFYEPIYRESDKLYIEMLSSYMIPIEKQSFWMGSAQDSNMKG